MGQLGQPDLGPRRRAGRRASTAYLAAVYLVWDARRLSDERDGRRTSGVRAIVAAVVAGVVAVRRHLRAPQPTPTYLFDGLTSRALPLVILSAVCGARLALLLLARDRARGARLAAVGAVASVVVRLGRRPVGLPAPERLTVSAAAAPSGPSRRSWSPPASRRC